MGGSEERARTIVVEEASGQTHCAPGVAGARTTSEAVDGGAGAWLQGDAATDWTSGPTARRRQSTTAQPPLIPGDRRQFMKQVGQCKCMLINFLAPKRVPLRPEVFPP